MTAVLSAQVSGLSIMEDMKSGVVIGEPFALMDEVLLHPDAQTVYANADQALAKKIARCLQQLEQTPRSSPNSSITQSYNHRKSTELSMRFMIQAEFNLDESQLEFLNQFEHYGFRDESELVRTALTRLKAELH
jgi:hypothetical protein